MLLSGRASATLAEGCKLDCQPGCSQLSPFLLSYPLPSSFLSLRPCVQFMLRLQPFSSAHYMVKNKKIRLKLLSSFAIIRFESDCRLFDMKTTKCGPGTAHVQRILGGSAGRQKDKGRARCESKSFTLQTYSRCWCVVLLKLWAALLWSQTNDLHLDKNQEQKKKKKCGLFPFQNHNFKSTKQ